jgi:hypothetical protein
VGVEGVGFLIISLAFFHSTCSSGSWLPSLELHWSLRHLCWLVTDFCRRLTSAFRRDSIEIYLASLTTFMAYGPYVISQATLVVDSPNRFEMALDSSLTHVKSRLIREVTVGREPRFRLAWNLDVSSFSIRMV